MDLLPLELLLPLAANSPASWYSFVRVLPPLALFVRSNSPFRSRLQDSFSSSRGSLTVLPDGTRHGLCLEFLDLSPAPLAPLPAPLPSFGRLPALLLYSLGRREGKFFAAEGDLALRGRFVSGELHGRLLLKEGEEITTFRFCLGRPVGKSVTRVEGRRRRTTEYWNGERNGAERRFSPDGSLWKETSYFRGEISGISACYSGETAPFYLSESYRDSPDGCISFFAGGLLFSRAESKGNLTREELWEGQGFLVKRERPLSPSGSVVQSFDRGELFSVRLVWKGQTCGPCLFYSGGEVVSLVWYEKGREVGRTVRPADR